MKTKKMKLELLMCEVAGNKYVRTYIDWNDERPIEISWHLNEDQVDGKIYPTEKHLEERFQLNNSKPVKIEHLSMECPPEETKKISVGEECTLMEVIDLVQRNNRRCILETDI